MNKNSFIAVTLAAALVISFSGCAREADATSVQVSSSESEPHSCDVFAMDTYMSLKAYGSNADTALSAASARIYELEDVLSVTSEGSDVWSINNSGGSSVEVSDDTAAIISAGLEYGDLTSGALDITIYPLVREWGFTTGNYHIPDDETISALLENVDYKNISLNDNTVTAPDDYQIDLGALAKGYTSDEIMGIFRDNGVPSAIISLGGNVQALGDKPDGSMWKVAVKNPFATDEDMCIVQISNKAVITSGNYERFFVGEDGNTYCHIIDSADGRPADNGLVSVTIIGESGLMCDALSTALYVSGTDKACDYWREHGGFDMILVTDDQRILYTDGIAETFQNISGMTAEAVSND